MNYGCKGTAMIPIPKSLFVGILLCVFYLVNNHLLVFYIESAGKDML